MTFAELVDVAWIYRTPDPVATRCTNCCVSMLPTSWRSSLVKKQMRKNAIWSFFLRLVGGLEVALTGPESAGCLEPCSRRDRQYPGRLEPCCRTRDAAHRRRRLQALHLFFIMRSRYTEGKQLFAAAVHRFAQPADIRDSHERTRARLPAAGRLGVFHLHFGEMQAAERCFAAVVDGSTDERELAFVFAKIGELGRQQGSRPAAEAALRKSLSLAKASGDRELTAEALLGLSDLLSSFGEFAVGEQHAREALALCRPLQRADLMARALAALAWCVSCLGGYAEAERYYSETLAISKTMANPFGIALATNFLGWVAYCKGGARLAEAADLHAQALAIWRRIGNRSFVAMCLGDCALAAYELGDYVEAIRLAREGVTVAEELKQSDLLSYNLNVLGAATCRIGDLAESRRHLFRSLQIAHERRMPDKAALMLYFLAQLFIQEGTISAASSNQPAAQQVAALELLAFVIDQPATWQVVRDRARTGAGGPVRPPAPGCCGGCTGTRPPAQLR